MESPVEPISFRRLIVCCDGEWEGAGKDPPVKGHPNSHVLVLSKCVLGDDTSSTASPPIKQLVHYQGGEDDTLLYRRETPATRDAKLQFVEHCQVAYDFISGNYHAGDELFFFGFSFGAAVARTVAAFVADIGIVRGEALTYFQNIFKTYMAPVKSQMAPVKSQIEAVKSRMEIVLNQYRKLCKQKSCKHDSCEYSVQKVPPYKIKCVGVWDTVKLLEIPGGGALSPDIAFGFHAMAAGSEFGVFKWTPPEPEDVTQVIQQIQFDGSHGDIGGVGNHEKGIISLIWMIANLIHHKLLAVDEINLKRLVPIEVLREGEYLKPVIDKLPEPIVNPERQVLDGQHATNTVTDATVNQSKVTLLPFEWEMLKGSPRDPTGPTRLKLSHPGAKRIVVFIDGTTNDGEDFKLAQRTNVWRLFQSVAPVNVQTNTTQFKRYFAGIGTNDRSSVYHQKMESAGGSGIMRQIKQAYTQIAANYATGDEIFLFGFSRGAFAIRTLASLITQFGLYHPVPNSAEEKELMKMWEIAEDEPKFDIQTHESTLKFKGRLPMGNTVKCVGVWDTVVSVLNQKRGWFDRLTDYTSILEPAKFFGFCDELLDPNIEHAFHAMALHEDRVLYNVTKWKLKAGEDPKRVSQVWFPGFHSDVGGGNPNQDLAILSLVWMIAKIEGEISDKPMLSIDHYQLRGVLFPLKAWAEMTPIRPAEKIYNKVVRDKYKVKIVRKLDTDQESIHGSCLPLTFTSTGTREGIWGKIPPHVKNALEGKNMLNLEKRVQSGWKTLHKEPVEKEEGGDNLEFLAVKEAKEGFEKFLIEALDAQQLPARHPPMQNNPVQHL